MEALKSLLPYAFSASLAGLVAAVGLNARPGDLTYLLWRPRRLLKAVAAVNLITPAAAVLLVSIFPLSPIARLGILLMAVSPAPPLIPGNSLKVGAERAYVYGLYAGLALLAAPLTSLAVTLLAGLYGVDFAASPGLVGGYLATTVLAPLLAGLLVSRLAPAFAAKAAPIVSAVSMTTLYAAAGPVVLAAWPQMASLAGDGTLLVIALTVVAALAAGHVLGGPERSARAALAVASATRHPGLALLIAGANDADPRVRAAILAFLLVGLVLGAIYRALVARRGRQLAAQDQA